MEFYRQCRMTKGPAYTVGFISEKHAVIGKFVRLGQDDGWHVVSAGKRVSIEALREK